MVIITNSQINLVFYTILFGSFIIYCRFRNGPSSSTGKCQSDHKGRYLGSVTVQTDDKDNSVESKVSTTFTDNKPEDMGL